MRLNLFFFLLCLLSSVQADSLTPIPIARTVHFDQNLGAQVPRDLSFFSDTGAPVLIGSYFNHRPMILVLDYYRCPNLCGVVLNSLVESLKNLTLNPGERFDVLVVSIDPRDKPPLSAQKKEAYLAHYARPETAGGWHFLTGSPDASQRLADTVGFHFTYDPDTDQYAHPSGIMVLTPSGKISRYFFGVEYPPRDLHDALVLAATDQVSSPVEDFLILCCQYNPLQGKYGALIFAFLRVAGCSTAFLLIFWVARSILREKDAQLPEVRK